MDPHQNDKLDPDPDLDLDPHEFADVKSKCTEYALI